MNLYNIYTTIKTMLPFNSTNIVINKLNTKVVININVNINIMNTCKALELRLLIVYIKSINFNTIEGVATINKMVDTNVNIGKYNNKEIFYLFDNNRLINIIVGYDINQKLGFRLM